VDYVQQQIVDGNCSPSPCRDVDAQPRPMKHLFLASMNVKVGRGEDGGRGLGSVIYASTLRTNSLHYERKAMKCQLTRG
jgi:hypothetical protein